MKIGGGRKGHGDRKLGVTEIDHWTSAAGVRLEHIKSADGTQA